MMETFCKEFFCELRKPFAKNFFTTPYYILQFASHAFLCIFYEHLIGQARFHYEDNKATRYQHPCVPTKTKMIVAK
jgi:hypothetical protein